jgi:hypothetical protein
VFILFPFPDDVGPSEVQSLMVSLVGAVEGVHIASNVAIVHFRYQLAWKALRVCEFSYLQALKTDTQSLTWQSMDVSFARTGCTADTR